jgi:hypothetical protein
MKCPSCNQAATSFLRSSFSLQGVSFVQSLQGKLKCQHCGVLLRTVKYDKQIWYFLIACVMMLALIILFSKRLMIALGIGAVAIYWIVFTIMVVLVFVYGTWKYGVLEKVYTEEPRTP